MTTTLDEIRIFNLRYNVTSASAQYAKSMHNISSAMTKPNRQKYKSVNQLLKECPLVGSTKLGRNFIG